MLHRRRIAARQSIVRCSDDALWQRLPPLAGLTEKVPRAAQAERELEAGMVIVGDRHGMAEYLADQRHRLPFRSEAPPIAECAANDGISVRGRQYSPSAAFDARPPVRETMSPLLNA